MELHNNSFCSPWRRCSACGVLQSKGSYAKCSKCKVFVYCNKDCQTKHWKSEHKASCRPQPHIPPPLQECVFPAVETGDDLDKPYRYILINPPKSNKLSREEWLTTVQGISDEGIIKDLDALILAQPGERLNRALMCLDDVDSHEKKTQEKIIKKLQGMFKWDTLGSSPVPGFSSRYDGYTLRRLYDDNCKFRPELGANRSAEVLCMQEDGTLNGTLLLWCSASGDEARLMQKQLDNDTTPETAFPPGYNAALPPELNPDISHLPPPPPDLIVPITRRSVLQAVEYNQESGAVGAVPERIHFENISRASALSFFKKENFTML